MGFGPVNSSMHSILQSQLQMQSESTWLFPYFLDTVAPAFMYFQISSYYISVLYIIILYSSQTDYDISSLVVCIELQHYKSHPIGMKLTA